MLGEYRSMTLEDAYRTFMHDQPLPRFVQAAQDAIPPDPLPEATLEADLEDPATPEPPRCEICED